MRAAAAVGYFEMRAMGSDVVVHVVDSHPERYDQHEERIRRRLGQLEGAWTRFDPDSELSRLNNGTGGTTRVSSDLATGLRTAIGAWHLTEGRFDPTVGVAMENLGYDRDWRSVATDSGPTAPASPAPGCSGVAFLDELDLLLSPPGVHFDLGGLGKGLAADIIATEAIDFGADGIAISVGGDLCCVGMGPAGAPWQVQMVDANGFHLATTRFDSGGAIATSSSIAKRFDDGRHHLVDPRTGNSTTGSLVHVSVIAQNCVTAEVWTKAAMNLEPGQAIDLLARHDLGAVLVDDNGWVHTTSASSHSIGASVT